jgi:hypothetical protein
MALRLDGEWFGRRRLSAAGGCGLTDKNGRTGIKKLSKTNMEMEVLTGQTSS